MTIPDILTRTLSWFQKARPEPGRKDFHSQLGCHVEEFNEMLRCLSSHDRETLELLNAARLVTEQLAEHLKTSHDVVWVEHEDQTEFLDGLCDQIVTAVGVAWVCQYDILGAMREVNASNFSKFDAQENPIYNDHRKVIKGPFYRKPDLTPFLHL